MEQEITGIMAFSNILLANKKNHFRNVIFLPLGLSNILMTPNKFSIYENSSFCLFVNYR